MTDNSVLFWLPNSTREDARADSKDEHVVVGIHHCRECIVNKHQRKETCKIRTHSWSC